MSEITVREAQPDEENQIVKLLEDNLPWPGLNIDTSNHDHWRWKYLDSPIMPSIAVVIEAQGEIIGCAHACITRLKIRDKTVYAANGYDVVIRQDYRGRGLFNLLVEKRKEILNSLGVEIIFWSSGNIILVEKWSRVSNPYPHPIDGYIKINNLMKTTKTLNIDNKNIMILGYSSLEKLNNLLYRERSSPENITVTKINSFTEETDQLWNRISQHYDLIYEKTAEYLNYRYLDPRAGNYTAYKAEKDQIQGYAITHIKKVNDLKIGYISDILSETPEAAKALLQQAVNDMDDADLITVLGVKNHQSRQYKTAGLLDGRRLFHLTYNELGEPLNIENTNPMRAYFCYGDRDSLPSGV